MVYKVFLVEDEITTRDGIRDNVDWKSAGFELCGESPDGEIALSQIETTQPDVLITDIKMPFMDGLQLCKIIREHMPWMKIIIISGYNDFHYAQTAIKLGVTEYLLKPVSVQNLQETLSRVAVSLDQERIERAQLKRLRSQVEDNLSMLREKFLLRLVTGGESSLSAIEQSQQLGLSLLSAYYQVVLLEIKPGDGARMFDFQTCQRIEQLITEMIGTNPDVMLTKKDLEEYCLILKGENLDQLAQEGPFIVRLIQSEVEKETKCKLVYGFGSPQQRLGDLHRSFAEALVKVKGSHDEIETGELEKLDHALLRSFLETGSIEELPSFIAKSIEPIIEAALRSRLLKQYVLIDLVLAATQFVSDLGGNTERIIPPEYQKNDYPDRFQTIDQIKSEITKLFSAAIEFRGSLTENNRPAIIQQAKSYIAAHFSNPDLSLNEVAAQVNFSPNHFSAVFKNETGVNFRDYLAQTRLEQAKKLLITTSMKCAEVAYQCGYNDPHYFSLIFRRNYNQSPKQFRASNRKSLRRGSHKT